MKAVVHLAPPKITPRLLLFILSAWLLVDWIKASSTDLETAISLAAEKWNQPFTIIIDNKSTLKTHHSIVKNDLARIITRSKARQAICCFSYSWKEFGDRPIEILQPIDVAHNLYPVAQEKNSYVVDNSTTQKAVFKLGPYAMVQLIAAGDSKLQAHGSNGTQDPFESTTYERQG